SIGTFGLYLDGISIPFALTIYIICTAVALYSFPYMKHRILEQERDARKPERIDAVGSEVEKPTAPSNEVSSQGNGTASITVQVQSSSSPESQRVKSRFGLFAGLLLLYSAGMVGTVLATNLIELYFFFEFMLVPSYFLIAEFGYGARGRISLMYLLWTHIGALLMLLGFLAIGTQTGNFVFLGPGATTAVQIAASLLPFIVFAIV